MTPFPGARLGPYEIVSPIGSGGMGEVFKARGTRLDRSVAIKVLSAELVNDARLKLRFEREAISSNRTGSPQVCMKPVFLLNSTGSGPRSVPFTVVLNWMEALKQ